MPVEMQVGESRLQMDGEWGLVELSSFGRQYEQIYSLLYALEISGDDAEDQTRWAFTSFPWRGGWSAVDFFVTLGSGVPRRHRPRVKRIEYSSPGFIDLALVVALALTLGKIIKAICESVDRISATCNNIIKGIRERELGRISVRRETLELGQAELDFLKRSDLPDFFGPLITGERPSA